MWHVFNKTSLFSLESELQYLECRTERRLISPALLPMLCLCESVVLWRKLSYVTSFEQNGSIFRFGWPQGSIYGWMTSNVSKNKLFPFEVERKKTGAADTAKTITIFAHNCANKSC